MFTLTLNAANAFSPSATQTLTVNVVVPKPPTIKSAAATTFTTGAAGSFTITAKGKPTPALTESGVLPSGVTFVDNGNGTATLSGTPVAGNGGIYVVALKAKNGDKPNSKQTFVLTIDQAPAITSANTTAFTTGTFGKFTITTTGFPTAGILESGALPAGITFIDTGDGKARLHGTPAAGTAGTYTLTIKAKNGVKPKATQTFTLVIDAAAAAAAAAASPASTGADTIINDDIATESIILSSAGDDTILA
jgi:hypothetical protein